MTRNTLTDDTYDHQIVEQLASSIALQLTMLFPTGPSATVKTPEDNVMTNAMQVYLRNLVIEADTYHHDIVKRALPLAVRQWKDQSGATATGPILSSSTETTKTSFSLLDQLNSGGFALPVTWEEIQALPTLSERLAKLHKIEYVDDVLPEWIEFQVVLLSGLLSNEEGDTLVQTDFLQLHRRWFDQARASGEYIGLQYGLCHNLSTSICKCLLSSTNAPREPLVCGVDDEEEWTLLVPLLQTWHDMFLDLMQRNQYSSDSTTMKEMEVSYLLWLKTYQALPKESHSSKATRPVQILSALDPRAHLFGAWVHHVSPQYLIALLERTQLLSDLINRSQSTASEAKPMGRSVEYNSLAIIAFCLIKTRLKDFPFHCVASSTTTTPRILDSKLSNYMVDEDSLVDQMVDAPFPSVQEIDALLDLFLQPLLSLQHQNWLVSLCAGAVDTILSGCRGIEVDMDGRISKVRAVLSEMTSEHGKTTTVQQLDDQISQFCQ